MVVVNTLLTRVCNRVSYKTNILNKRWISNQCYQMQNHNHDMVSEENETYNRSIDYLTSSTSTFDNDETSENLYEDLNEDLSHITPYVSNTFNFAAYVNKSKSLQNLVKLGVNLSKIEKKPYLMEKIMRLDFEKDMKPHIFFLTDYIPSEHIGLFITKNPMIFYESLDNLQVRVNYLLSKRFREKEISRIIDKNPFWLMFSTMRIDRRLGYFQKKFGLIGEEVRLLSTRLPRIITYNIHHINTNSFVIKEEMGFDDYEIKSLILNKPKLWMINQLSLITSFNYLHNVMKIPHNMILHSPGILLCRLFKLQQRHLFLEKLGRAQYDPKEANYVPPLALAEGTDVEFCRNYAKCTVEHFNVFLKTL